MTNKPINKNSLWRHYNGNEYKVMCIGNEYSEDFIKYPKTVVYSGINGRIWCRPLTEWHRSFTLIKE